MKFKPKLIIYCSTYEVYGQVKSKILSEDNPIFNPIVYGQTKLLAEKILEENHKTISLRMPSVVGKGSRGWIMKIYNQLKSNKRIEILNGKFNNMIHQDDLSKLILNLILNKCHFSEQFNLSCSKPIMSKKVVEIMKQNMNSKSILISKNNYKKSYIISNKKISKFYKFMTVEKAIKKLLIDIN